MKTLLIVGGVVILVLLGFLFLYPGGQEEGPFIDEALEESDTLEVDESDLEAREEDGVSDYVGQVWGEVRGVGISFPEMEGGSAAFGEAFNFEMRKGAREYNFVETIYISEGTGTFYYVTAFVKEDGELRNTDSVLIGDRVIIQSILVNDIEDGVRVSVSYLDRGEGEPMAAAPTVRETKVFELHDDGRFIPVAEFE